MSSSELEQLRQQSDALSRERDRLQRERDELLAERQNWQLDVDNHQWLKENLAELFFNSSQAAIKTTLEKLCLRVGASGYWLAGDHRQIASGDIDRNTVTLASIGLADPVQYYQQAILRERQEVYFTCREDAPPTIQADNYLTQILNSYDVQGLCTITVGSQKQKLSLLILDWSDGSRMPSRDAIHALALPIARAAITISQQLRAQNLTREKIEHERWLSQTLEQLYASGDQRGIQQALDALREYLKADRLGLRHKGTLLEESFSSRARRQQGINTLLGEDAAEASKLYRAMVEECHYLHARSRAELPATFHKQRPMKRFMELADIHGGHFQPLRTREFSDCSIGLSWTDTRHMPPEETIAMLLSRVGQGVLMVLSQLQHRRELQRKAEIEEWLNITTNKLFTYADLSAIKETLAELRRFLGAQRIGLRRNNTLIYENIDENSAQPVGLNQLMASDLTAVTEAYRIITSKYGYLHLPTRSSLPEELRVPAMKKYFDAINFQAGHFQLIKSRDFPDCTIGISWENREALPEEKVIAQLSSTIGRSILMTEARLLNQVALQNKARQESWLLEQVKTIYAGDKQLDDDLYQVFANLCDYLGGDRVVIEEQLDTGRRAVVEFCKPGIPSRATSLTELAAENRPDNWQSWLATPLVITDGEDANFPEAVRKAFLYADRRVDAVIQIPLPLNTGRQATLYVDSLSGPKTWGQQELRLLNTIAYALCMATIQQQTLQRLRASEKRFSEAMEVSQDGFWEWNLATDEFYISPAYLKMMGYPSDDPSLKHSRDLILQRLHPGDLPWWHQQIERVQAGKLGFNNGQIRLMRPDGSFLYCYSRCHFTEVDPEGRALRLTGVISNITHFVLQQQDLEEARKTAEAANNAKSDFLARMSHEIRTPMNAIIGLTRLLQDGPFPEEQGSYINNIDHAAKGLLEIINDVLDFSKIEAGKLDLVEGPFDLSELIHKAFAVFSYQANQKHLDYQLECDPRLPSRVIGDSVRLRQILFNLLSNALKFTEQGGVNLAVRALDKSGGASQIEFKVTDTGIGIPSHFMAGIFEPFSQADGSISRHFGGTGLGLSIISSLLKMMDGNIYVESEEGKGTCFTVILPLPEAYDESGSQAETLSAPIEEKSLSGLHLLVAEDNLVNQQVARGMLHKYGISCDFANNGQEAIDALSNRPDLYQGILMDIEMPKINGYEATKYIRNAMASAIPIVAMTAHASHADEIKSIKSGMNAYLTKPIDADKLRRVICRYICD